MSCDVTHASIITRYKEYVDAMLLYLAYAIFLHHFCFRLAQSLIHAHVGSPITYSCRTRLLFIGMGKSKKWRRSVIVQLFTHTRTGSRSRSVFYSFVYVRLWSKLQRMRSENIHIHLMNARSANISTYHVYVQSISKNSFRPRAWRY